MDGAGVVALAVAADACRHCQQTYCGAALVVRRSCFAAVWRRSLGAMVGDIRVCIIRVDATMFRYVSSKRRANQCFPIVWYCCYSLAAGGGVKSQERWTEQLRHSRCGSTPAIRPALRSSHQCGGSMASITSCKVTYSAQDS
jgi:hypothetical protein